MTRTFSAIWRPAAGIVAAASALFFMAGPTFAATRIDGKWLTQGGGAIIQVKKCGRAFCGTIVKVLKPGPGGLKDLNNPNPKLRNRPLVGTQVLTNLMDRGAYWDGQVYTPTNGRTFAVQVTRVRTDRLTLKGCIGPLCTTQIWSAVR